jgi:23S rRNA (cytidine1920-2'-O)/16S rRNA (cytidine1409-2'-O)-methyltransferase
MEGINARDLNAHQIPEAIELLVCDVSFVSVAKVLSAPLALCTGKADVVILIKPQFEVGREAVGKGGLVTDAGAIETAIGNIIQFMAEQGFAHRVSVASPIAGGDGNKETVAVFARMS